MSSSLLAGAIEAASRARDAEHLRHFKQAVGDFVHALGEVPDEQAGTLSSDEARALQSLGQDVIDHIEQRIPDTASAPDAQMLASSVYEIRRLLEEISLWRRHYSTARHV